MNRTQQTAFRLILQKLISKSFGKPVKLAVQVERTEEAGDSFVVTWDCAGWRGDLLLARPGQRELTAKELGGVLSLLQSVED